MCGSTVLVCDKGAKEIEGGSDLCWMGVLVVVVLMVVLD